MEIISFYFFVDYCLQIDWIVVMDLASMKKMENTLMDWMNFVMLVWAEV